MDALESLQEVLTMKTRIRPKTLTASGFTLLELLVVVFMVGVLMAIAAPSWNAFLSNQRLGAARQRALQFVRKAQTESRRLRYPHAVVFREDASNKKAEVATIPFKDKDSLDPSKIQASAWFPLGEDNAQAISVITNRTSGDLKNALVFDTNGAVAQLPVVPVTQSITESNPFQVTVSNSSAIGAKQKRCFKIETILGSPFLADGTNCGS